MSERLDDAVLRGYRNARAAWIAGNKSAAEIYYAENRRDHAVDLYYEVALPEHVLMVHPIGTVLGRATYGDYLVCYQNVGVGSDIDGNRPVIGEGVVLFPGAKVLGKTKIGNNVFVQANVVVQNCVVPDNSLVYSHGPEWRSLGRSILSCDWKPTKHNVKQHFFGVA